jgi:hypothetical protein
MPRAKKFFPRTILGTRAISSSALSWEVKAARYVGQTSLTPSYAACLEILSLKLLET